MWRKMTPEDYKYGKHDWFSVGRCPWSLDQECRTCHVRVSVSGSTILSEDYAGTCEAIIMERVLES